MALSWIFGKKKEEKSSPVSAEAIEVGSDGDYAIIQSSSRPGIYPQVPAPIHPYTPLPYPTTLPFRTHPQTTGNNAPNNVQNQLEGIPFSLSPHLQEDSNRDSLAQIEDLRRAIFQTAAEINDPAFQYSFKLESAIMQEAYSSES